MLNEAGYIDPFLPACGDDGQMKAMCLPAVFAVLVVRTTVLDPVELSSASPTPWLGSTTGIVLDVVFIYLEVLMQSS